MVWILKESFGIVILDSDTPNPDFQNESFDLLWYKNIDWIMDWKAF